MFTSRVATPLHKGWSIPALSRCWASYRNLPLTSLDTILTETKDKVGLIRLNRPEQLVGPY